MTALVTPDAVEAAARAKSLVTTDVVRAAYIGPDTHWMDSLVAAEFDRWLAAHDAQVAQQTLLDAANDVFDTEIPAEIAHWLTARAATLTPKDTP